MTENLTPTPLDANDETLALNTAATEPIGTEIAASQPESIPTPSATIVNEEPAIVEDDHEAQEEEHDFDDELPNFGSFTKEQLLTAIAELKDKPVEETAKLLKAIKPALDIILQEEYNIALQKFTEEGGEKDDFEYTDKDQARELFNKASKELKQKRAEEKARQDADRIESLKKKENILVQIKQLTEDEETEGSLKKLKELQNEWKQIRNVPKDQVERLWESYHLYIHQFYDRLSMFNELKDLDRKKNLDHKIELIQKAAELALEPSAKRALIILKKLQDDWRNIGPVPQESNEEIWSRFKQECDKIYEMIKSVQEQNQKVREENLEAKKALLAKALELSNYTTKRVKDWFDTTNVANQLMEDWKKIGMVPLKYRESVWNEFRNARNQFYANKNNFFKAMHAERNNNLKAKTELCEKAEQIAANPIDLNKQTDELKRLQEQWKSIGPVNDKISDAIWKRFRAACDSFFEKKAQHYAGQIEEQKQNLEIKKQVIAKLELLLEKEEHSDILTDLKAIQEEWNNTGFVPMSEKEKLNKVYAELNDKAFQKFKEVSKELRDMKEKSHLEALLHSPNGDMKVKREEKQLIDRIRGLRNDIYTWENNLGFFTKGNSKTENPMIKQIEEKIAQANKQIEQMDAKLKSIRTFIKQAQKA